ncbi:MAG: M20/M25/M40 family metallo-hydrolase [Candidatus Cloacimonetes bacterium]|nr:M20/M25/M40 family metallo-hydrolase [Candidatus Cloacimonadota bacterium]
MESIELLKKLTLAAGISGHESEITRIMKESLADLAYEEDRMGNITFIKRGKEQGRKLLFIAHQDEIGFIVADILPSGMLKIQNIGGWDPNTLLSSPVDIINDHDQKIPGIIGSIPKHFLADGSTMPQIANMFIDIGAIDKADAIQNFGISLGNAVIPVCRFYYNEQNKRMFSKAFDDRVGIAALIDLGRELAEEELENTLYLCGSVQEEVGTRGAQAIAAYTDADICFVLEGAPADDIPGIPGTPQTCVGKGVHLRIYDPTLIIPKPLRDSIMQIARKYDIPVQPTVRRGGGTDGRQIHTANKGIPTIVLGVPVRFAHSHNCHISLDDYQNLVALCIEIAREYRD